MTAAKPYGNRDTATLLVIGHDPRLRTSRAEAQYAFFFDYLERPQPAQYAEARKYDLAQSLWDYVSYLAGRTVEIEELYITNLCNEFLPHQSESGTVLIPDELAARGVEQIQQAVAQGHFRLILPMSLQTFYHLCRLGFVDENTDLVKSFVASAQPRATKAREGIYMPTRTAAFLAVCGQRFHHHGVPVVPILHVRQWPLRDTAAKYKEPMQKAHHRIASIA